jgi:hypothetical protein
MGFPQEEDQEPHCDKWFFRSAGSSIIGAALGRVIIKAADILDEDEPDREVFRGGPASFPAFFRCYIISSPIGDGTFSPCFHQRAL